MHTHTHTHTHIHITYKYYSMAATYMLVHLNKSIVLVSCNDPEVCSYVCIK